VTGIKNIVFLVHYFFYVIIIQQFKKPVINNQATQTCRMLEHVGLRKQALGIRL
jgi:hypothetical protein